MLNRRLLRGKAMQYIYAFKQCQRANKFLGTEYIDLAFKPDLNAMEQPDPAQVAVEHNMADELYRRYFDDKKLVGPSTPEISDIVLKAVELYHKMSKKDKDRLGKELIVAVEKIFESYLLMLLLLLELATESARGRKKSIDVGIRQEIFEPASPNFSNNQIIKAIKSNEKLHILADEKKVHWNEYRSEVRQWFKSIIATDESFLQYQALPSIDFDRDKEMVREVINLLFENETVTEFLEERDLNWAENKKIIKGMLKKSIKSVTKEQQESIEITDLSNNWDEDKDFLEELYHLTVDHEEEYESIISGKIKNWTVDRLTMVDHTILKMAIAEMINFPSIPVKVTINEYIDLSKNYSTPKSKQFVNGLLDVIATDLQQQGKINKSGRGLIDNR